MPEETLGYIELEWTCRNCGTRNKGTEKRCSRCGALMAEDQEFELPAQQEIISPSEIPESVKAGPDIHCPWCGARNPAGAQRCAECGGDLIEGKARARGKVVGAYKAEVALPVICPYCGTSNPASAQQCSKCGGNLIKQEAEPSQEVKAPAFRLSPILIAILIIGLCLVGAFIARSFRTTDVTAVVQDVSWTRSVQVLALRPVVREGWHDEIPAGARLGSCEERLRRVQEEEVAGAKKVCGTPYVVDDGTGLGKVKQDCQYEVYEKWCEYEVNDWQVVRTETVSRNDLQPAWPALSMGSGEREGARAEKYTIVFDNDGQKYTYVTDSADEFAMFEIGSEWALKVNQIGQVVSVSPAR